MSVWRDQAVSVDTMSGLVGMGQLRGMTFLNLLVGVLLAVVVFFCIEPSTYFINN